MTVYTLPSTHDERRQLVEEITRWCATVLGYPTRQPNISNWNQMSMPKLRHAHKCWQEVIASREAAGGSVTGQTKLFDAEREKNAEANAITKH